MVMLADPRPARRAAPPRRDAVPGLVKSAAWVFTAMYVELDRLTVEGPADALDVLDAVGWLRDHIRTLEVLAAAIEQARR